ncbi:glycosyltransferase family 2 protein [Hugenholtzia roseola]|uniref:glycosyltransferase family 2 protein n=1 Tax=Hugenholtzia roseola TaxID=1002 RepID=UPI00040A7070|nr:glycosyltransferase family 2 protein [Hugenholtzia roseola]
MKISIITPSYNQGAFLEKTLRSVEEQQYPFLEHIVIDGGSQDNSVEIIKKYEKNLAYWESKPDKGQSDALNKGFARATGEIITWLNSDDYLLPNALHKVAQAFQESKKQNKELDLVFGKSILFGDKMSDTISAPKSPDLAWKGLAGLPFAQPSSFFSRKHLEMVQKVDENYHYGMDYDFFVPIFLSGKYQEIDFIFSKYLYHTNSKTVMAQAKFAVDYAKIFSKVLRTLGATVAIEKMKQVGFYSEGTDRYSVEVQEKFKNLTEAAQEKLLAYHLHNLLIFYYQGLALKETQQIANFLAFKLPAYVRQNPELEQVRWRSRYLPAWLIRLLRR